MKKFILLTIISFAFTACQQNLEREQNLEQLDKVSAREVVLSTSIVGDTVYHISNQKIWSNNQLVTEKIDTIKTPKQVSDSIKAPIYVTIQ